MEEVRSLREQRRKNGDFGWKWAIYEVARSELAGVILGAQEEKINRYSAHIERFHKSKQALGFLQRESLFRDKWWRWGESNPRPKCVFRERLRV